MTLLLCDIATVSPSKQIMFPWQPCIIPQESALYLLSSERFQYFSETLSYSFKTVRQVGQSLRSKLKPILLICQLKFLWDYKHFKTFLGALIKLELLTVSDYFRVQFILRTQSRCKVQSNEMAQTTIPFPDMNKVHVPDGNETPALCERCLWRCILSDSVPIQAWFPGLDLILHLKDGKPSCPSGRRENICFSLLSYSNCLSISRYLWCLLTPSVIDLLVQGRRKHLVSHRCCAVIQDSHHHSMPTTNISKIHTFSVKKWN